MQQAIAAMQSGVGMPQQQQQQQSLMGMVQTTQPLMARGQQPLHAAASVQSPLQMPQSAAQPQKNR